MVAAIDLDQLAQARPSTTGLMRATSALGPGDPEPVVDHPLAQRLDGDVEVVSLPQLLAGKGGPEVGRDGTFGRVGLATKVVTVLRSTEALRLKLLPMQDEGLVYETAKAEAVMEQGRLTIRSFELDSTSYAISATGEIDFAANRSYVPIEVNAIKGLTEILGRIPVAGDVLEIVNVRLVATGSPYDMKVSVASITDQLLGASMAGPKAVIKGVRDALRLLRGTSTSEAVPPPSPEPAPEPAVSPAPEAAPTVEAEPPPAPETPETSR